MESELLRESRIFMREKNSAGGKLAIQSLTFSEQIGGDLLLSSSPFVTLPPPAHNISPLVSNVCTALLNLAQPAFETDHPREWHGQSDQLNGARKIVHTFLRELIRQRRPYASLEWLKMADFISKKVEVLLYCAANSFTEYSNPDTLVQRVGQLVNSISGVLVEKNKEDQLSATFMAPASGAATSVSSSGPAILFPAVDSPSGAADEALLEDEDDGIAEPEEDGGILAAGGSEETEEFQASSEQFNATGDALAPNAAYTKNMVSCQGCSRVFIVKVLTHVRDSGLGKNLPSLCANRRDIVQGWLAKAKRDCCRPEYKEEEKLYGGSVFIENDSTTHWTESMQLYTWWKNNIERKSKFKVLQGDSNYIGQDARATSRAKWCATVIELADAIRTSTRNPSNLGIHEAVKYEMTELDDYGDRTEEDIVAMNEQPATVLPSAAAVSSTSSSLSPTARSLQPSSYAPSSSTVIASALCDSSVASQKLLASVARFQPQWDTQFRPLTKLKQASVPTAPMFSITAEFPGKLYDIVSLSDPSVVGWYAEGNAFQVRNTRKFADKTLPKYFSHKNFSQFQLEMQMFGFRRTRIVSNNVPTNITAFFHPQFRLGHRFEAQNIQRVAKSVPIGAITATLDIESRQVYQHSALDIARLMELESSKRKGKGKVGSAKGLTDSDAPRPTVSSKKRSTADRSDRQHAERYDDDASDFDEDYYGDEDYIDAENNDGDHDDYGDHYGEYNNDSPEQQQGASVKRKRGRPLGSFRGSKTSPNEVGVTGADEENGDYDDDENERVRFVPSKRTKQQQLEESNLDHGDSDSNENIYVRIYKSQTATKTARRSSSGKKKATKEEEDLSNVQNHRLLAGLSATAKSARKQQSSHKANAIVAHQSAKSAVGPVPKFSDNASSAAEDSVFLDLTHVGGQRLHIDLRSSNGECIVRQFHGRVAYPALRGALSDARNASSSSLSSASQMVSLADKPSEGSRARQHMLFNINTTAATEPADPGNRKTPTCSRVGPSYQADVAHFVEPKKPSSRYINNLIFSTSDLIFSRNYGQCCSLQNPRSYAEIADDQFERRRGEIVAERVTQLGALVFVRSSKLMESSRVSGLFVGKGSGNSNFNNIDSATSDEVKADDVNLCCVTKIDTTLDEPKVIIFDGAKTWKVNVSDCALPDNQSLHDALLALRMEMLVKDLAMFAGYEETDEEAYHDILERTQDFTRLTFGTNIAQQSYSSYPSTMASDGMSTRSSLAAQVSAADRAELSEIWTPSEVKAYIRDVRRFGENLRRVWACPTLRASKSFAQVVDFHHRLGVHREKLGRKKFLVLFERSDRLRRQAVRERRLTGVGGGQDDDAEENDDGEEENDDDKDSDDDNDDIRSVDDDEQVDEDAEGRDDLLTADISNHFGANDLKYSTSVSRDTSVPL